MNLDLRAGEVHALVGENGAGKSTLMKILAGVHAPDAGEVEYEGKRVNFASPRAAQNVGITIIHQELTLLGDRTVAENVFLGREPARGGRVDRARMIAETQALLDDIGESGISPRTPVRRLSVAKRQVVEIVKALAVDARVIAMDEPTAALADHEVELLYTLVNRLRDRGIAVLYVSHRLREVFDLADRITVLKDGALVTSRPTSQFTTDDLVRSMVGRPLSTFYPEADPSAVGDVVLSLRGSGNVRIHDIDLELRAGEIVGIAGLQGSGRSAIVRAVGGAEPFTKGEVLLKGVSSRIRSPRIAARLGIAHVTEDRKAEGLALLQSIKDNALLVRRSAFTRARRQRLGGFDLRAQLESVELNTTRYDRDVAHLSGGNQQKVVLAKWLATHPSVLLVDEPTRGIDVGAKAAIYQLLRDLAGRGAAILMVSSELPELIGMSDRILVMHNGRIAGELAAGASEEAVMALATGHNMAEAQAAEADAAAADEGSAP